LLFHPTSTWKVIGLATFGDTDCVVVVAVVIIVVVE